MITYMEGFDCNFTDYAFQTTLEFQTILSNYTSLVISSRRSPTAIPTPGSAGRLPHSPV